MNTKADFKKNITEFMQENDCVSFVELERIPGFIDDTLSSYWTTGFLDERNIMLWRDVTEEAGAALYELCRENIVMYMWPTTALVYLMDGGFLKLPIAKHPKHHYKKLRWLPVVFNRGSLKV